MNRLSRLCRQSPKPEKRWQGSGSAALACALLALLAAASPLAQAQGSWVWLDEQGRKVYSDIPPPASVPERRIQQRPGSDGLLTVSPAAATGAPAADGLTAPASDASRQNPARKGSADSAAPLYQRNEEALRENCRRARSALQTLNSGLQLYMLNEKGEQVEMDATGRAQEIQRMQQAERDNCVPERDKGKRQ
jgi:Domain of unknown function (DUF4124)